MKAVYTGDINIDADGVWTTGLSTCMFLCIQTSDAYVGWHFADANTNGDNMRRVHAILRTLKEVQHIFLVPGVDRDENYALKAACRTMRYRPGTDPHKSRDFFLQVLRSYSLLDRVVLVRGEDDLAPR